MDESKRLRSQVARLSAEAEALRGALDDVAERTMADGALCWCADDVPSGQHVDYCLAARAALAARDGSEPPRRGGKEGTT
jgi:hypothetical protein